jgi:hypothetical protein
MEQLVDFNRDIYLHLHAGTALPLRLSTSRPRPVVTAGALSSRPIPFSLEELTCATTLPCTHEFLGISAADRDTCLLCTRFGQRESSMLLTNVPSEGSPMQQTWSIIMFANYG